MTLGYLLLSLELPTLSKKRANYLIQGESLLHKNKNAFTTRVANYTSSLNSHNRNTWQREKCPFLRVRWTTTTTTTNSKMESLFCWILNKPNALRCMFRFAVAPCGELISFIGMWFQEEPLYSTFRTVRSVRRQEHTLLSTVPLRSSVVFMAVTNTRIPSGGFHNTKFCPNTSRSTCSRASALYVQQHVFLRIIDGKLPYKSHLLWETGAANLAQSYSAWGAVL